MDRTSDKIQWNEQNKIRVRESDESQQKHLIVKALVMLHLKIKHKKHSHWIKLYSEFPTTEGKICDIYYENVKTKEAFAYEIQKDNSSKWKKEIEEAYKNWEVLGMNSAEYVIIDINELSDNIEELSDQIKELIF
jgi:hypothetical protein